MRCDTMKLIKLAIKLKSEDKPALSEYLSCVVILARSRESEKFCFAFSAFDACLRTLMECKCISLYDYCYTYDEERKKIFDYLRKRYFAE